MPFFYSFVKTFHYLCRQKTNVKKKVMAKMTKEELLRAIKKAKENKEKARQKTAMEWKQEGIMGNVILI